MKYVPNAITRAVGRTVLRTQKNSPQLLFAAGLVGFGATVVLACKATLRLEDILVDTQKHVLETDRLKHQKDSAGVRRYSDDELNKDKAKIYFDATIQMGKLYAPAIVVGVVSVACLTKSHRILNERNATLTAAYVGLQKFLEDYRGRVREEIGGDRERDVYYASTPVELVEDTDKGPKKVYGSSPKSKSPYSALFDDNNGNWQDAHEFNVNFLRIQEQLLTDKLRAQGSLLLNEVYDRLDMPRTPTGALVGWMIGHPDSDDFVEFDIQPLHDFHGTLMVDFNVAGPVYDMLSGRASGRKS